MPDSSGAVLCSATQERCLLLDVSGGLHPLGLDANQVFAILPE